MISNDSTFKSKNIRYGIALLFGLSALCLFYALTAFFGVTIPGGLIGSVLGLSMILTGLLIVFAGYIASCLLRQKEENVPRLAKIYFLFDICAAGLCLILYIIVAATGWGTAAIGAIVGLTLRIGASVVILLTFMGVIPSKFIAAIITASFSFLNFVMFILTLCLNDLNNFNFELLAAMAFWAAFALYLFSQWLNGRQTAETVEEAVRDDPEQEMPEESEAPAPKKAAKHKVKAAKVAQEE